MLSSTISHLVYSGATQGNLMPIAPAVSFDVAKNSKFVKSHSINKERKGHLTRCAQGGGDFTFYIVKSPLVYHGKVGLNIDRCIFKTCTQAHPTHVWLWLFATHFRTYFQPLWGSWEVLQFTSEFKGRVVRKTSTFHLGLVLASFPGLPRFLFLRVCVQYNTWKRKSTHPLPCIRTQTKELKNGGSLERSRNNQFSPLLSTPGLSYHPRGEPERPGHLVVAQGRICHAQVDIYVSHKPTWAGTATVSVATYA